MRFWDYTPAELNLIIRTYNIKQKEDLKTLISCAYYTAAFQRVKRLPKLERFLSGLDKSAKPKRPATAEEMLEAVKQLNTAFSGEVNQSHGER